MQPAQAHTGGRAFQAMGGKPDGAPVAGCLVACEIGCNLFRCLKKCVDQFNQDIVPEIDAKLAQGLVVKADDSTSRHG